jgi:glycosyltransferase involved in cell wall biosynthesis
VFPSLIEPQGLALLEAYACGVPVVASRTGGIVEMLEHEVDGLLVQPGDPTDLASAILRMLNDGALQRRSIEHARSRLTAFDVRNIAISTGDLHARSGDVD